MQQVTLVGNLASKPEIRDVNGSKVADLRMACNKRGKRQDGTEWEKTVWFKVVVWGQRADVLARYTDKGSKIMVIGEMDDPEAYVNKDGKAVAINVVRLTDFEFLDAAKSATSATPATPAVDDSDDFPF